MEFDRKEKIAQFRKLAQNGHCSRAQYLAYAFLRGRNYVKLESKINEDKFPIIGRDTFLRWMAHLIGHHIIGKTIQGDSELYREIHNWIMEKYATSEEVAA
jgi:hypothetical protein